MLLSERLRELIDAAFSGLWITTAEPDEAIAEINRLAGEEEYQVIVEEPNPAFDPMAILQGLIDLDTDGKTTILCLPNFHNYLTDPAVKQIAYRLIQIGKKTKKYIIVLSAKAEIPAELEKYFIVVDHELPTRADLLKIAQEIGTEPGELPEGNELEKLIDAACGLTRYEAEGAFSLSLVRGGVINPREVWQIKEGALRKNGTMKLYRGGETFARLGGMNSMKSFCKDSMTSGGELKAKGILLLGPPGTGKSAFAKALGTETNRPTILLDIGNLMGSLVGQTEQALRAALNVIDAMAPCIIFVDEIEKALAGHGTDTSGVASRIVGTLLSWLADHTTDVFTIATANDVSRIPPELTRAGRFDGTFFIDLPSAEQRRAIWPIYLQRYAIEEQTTPNDEGWTGAEIENCCRLSALLKISLTDATNYIVPVSVTKSQAIDALRTESSGKYLDAEKGGIYSRVRTQQPADDTRRQVTRKRTDLE